jgi:hypothetical protein
VEELEDQIWKKHTEIIQNNIASTLFISSFGRVFSTSNPLLLEILTEWIRKVKENID